MNMKTISKILSTIILSALILTSCTKDNYDAPTSMISGRVVYQGEPLQLRGNEAVRLQLYQRGYEKHDPVEVFVNQNGEFSICIFDGQYQLITKAGNGPWSSAGRDTIEVTLKGRATQDVEVTPYYLVDNAQMTLNGNKIDASFTVNKIAGTGIDRVFIMLGTTQFLSDGEHNVDRYDETDNLGEFDETGKVYTFASRDYTDNQMFQTALKRGTLFGRICLWPQGSDQGIYSKVFRLK
jgi:PBP1b-binding outer membrane lipoprotein LpoB